MKRGFLLKLRSALCVRFWYHSTPQPPLYEGQILLQILEFSNFVRHILTNITRCRSVSRYQIIKCLSSSNLLGHEAQAESFSSPQGNRGGQRGTGTSFCQSTSVFPTSGSFHNFSIFTFHLSATGAVSFLQLTVYQ